MVNLEELLHAKQQRIDELHRLSAGRTALLVIDMQRSFMEPGASLALPTAWDLVAPIKKMVDFCRSVNIPVVFTNHTRYDLYAQVRMPLMPMEISQGLLQAYMPDFCSAVDLVISPSRGMEKILRQYGVDSHVEVVPNGANLKPFQTAKPLARAEFGFSNEDILLVYMGRVAPEKNLEFLLEAFAGVSRTLPNVHLLILGGGYKEYEEKLMALPRELHIAERVRFTGMIPYAQLPAYLSMCDIFVTTSVTEVHPFSVIEAMATGLPILGIDSPGVGDSISDRETGLLATNDLASFAAKMTYLCTDSALRKRMGNAAREASEQYDISRTTKIMLGHYTRLCGNTKPIKRSFDERLQAVLERIGGDAAAAIRG